MLTLGNTMSNAVSSRLDSECGIVTGTTTDDSAKTRVEKQINIPKRGLASI